MFCVVRIQKSYLKIFFLLKFLAGCWHSCIQKNTTVISTTHNNSLSSS